MAVDRETVLRDERELTEPVLAGLGPRPAGLSPVPDLVEVSTGEVAEGGANLRRRLVVTDLVAVTLAWVPSTLGGIEPAYGLPKAVVLALAMVVTSMVVLYANHLYLARVSAFRSIEIVAIGRCTVITVVLGIAMHRIAHIVSQGRWLVLGGIVMALLLLVARSGYRAWLTRARAAGRFVRPIVIVGTGADARELVDMLHDHPDAGYRVCGVVGERLHADASGLGELWRGRRADTLAIVRSLGANGVILVASDLAPTEMSTLVTELQQAGVHVHLSSGVRGINYRRLRATPIAYEPLFYLEQLQLSNAQLFAKRAADLVISVLLVVILAPLLAAIAIAIKLTDRGPVLFSQRRVGQHGFVFSVHKFRTMVVDAEARLAELNDQNERSGPLFKLTGDPRVTKVGRLLRSTSLDELPQLFNVIKGEMSLVGPRPALPSEVAQFDERLLSRSRVRPGITGLWQIEARDNPNFGAYRRLDLFYVDNWSFGLDLVIMLGTVEQVVAKAVSAVFGGHQD